MELINFIAGPLLKVTLLVVIAGITLRCISFSYAIIRNTSTGKPEKWWYPFVIQALSLFPYHKAAIKKPLYALLRYLFHFCLFIVFIWASGHIFISNLLGLQWVLTPMADEFTDGITLFLLISVLYFFIRRVIYKRIRSESSLNDYSLLFFTLLTIITGCGAYHQWVDYKTIIVLHMLSGEATLILTIFLFCTIRLDSEKCTGCAACTLICPTGTLSAKDTANNRILNYLHYKCICCGGCVSVCPEDAASLRHEINLKRLFQIKKERPVRTVELTPCIRCGSLYATPIQIQKVEQILSKTQHKNAMLKYCDKCRKMVQLEKMSLKFNSHN